MTKDGYFRKSGGFGDVELLGDLAPIEIGWLCFGKDKNEDGIQDANETPISNVTVKLYEGDSCSGTQVGEATTDSNGHYYFGGPNDVNMLDDNKLEYNTTYSICISLDDENLDNRTLTVNDAEDNSVDNRDSDGVIDSDGNNAIITLTTTNFNNHTYDFGFRLICLGDYVWDDANANGIQDAKWERNCWCK